MTEAEKLDAGMEYDFTEPEVRGRKFRAVKGCQKLNGIDMTDTAAREAAIHELFGSAGKSPVVLPAFHCDNGGNIHVGDNFFANYNVTILDNREVRIGNNVMIGPHTLIATVSHLLSPAKRRAHLAVAKPIRIGNVVWIGGNVTILPGIAIGNNVVIAAGAVVTADVPDNTLAAGVPARKIRALENDVSDGRE